MTFTKKFELYALKWWLAAGRLWGCDTSATVLAIHEKGIRVAIRGEWQDNWRDCASDFLNGG